MMVQFIFYRECSLILSSYYRPSIHQLMLSHINHLAYLLFFLQGQRTGKRSGSRSWFKIKGQGQFMGHSILGAQLCTVPQRAKKSKVFVCVLIMP